jgi:hypothetical protein
MSFTHSAGQRRRGHERAAGQGHLQGEADAEADAVADAEADAVADAEADAVKTGWGAVGKEDGDRRDEKNVIFYRYGLKCVIVRVG